MPCTGVFPTTNERILKSHDAPQKTDVFANLPMSVLTNPGFIAYAVTPVPINIRNCTL